jgi:hypothetical protein
MKNFFPLMAANFLLTIMLITSCDSPRSQRSISSSANNTLTSNGNIAAVNLDNSNSSTIATTTTAATTTAGVISIIPTDATHCKFATDGVNGFESTSTHLGDYTLCQSSVDKSIAYFQLKTPPTNSNGDISICLIPTTNSGSTSIYVGNPMCGYFKDPKSVRKINFIKYAEYTNATITGVIFFKDLSWYYPVYNNYMMTLEAYKTCMNMLTYGNAAYCQSFKNVGQYVFKQF